MTNRELILDYQAVRDYARRYPDVVLAKRLGRLARQAEDRGLGPIIEAIEEGHNLPSWCVPGADTMAIVGEIIARRRTPARPRHLQPA